MIYEHLTTEVEAESLDKAVEKALLQLRCSRAEADVEILQMPTRGFLGILGNRPARVRVKLHDRGAVARQIACRVLHLSGFEAEVDLTTSSQRLDLNLRAKDPRILIGHHGQTLDSIEFLVVSITDRLTTDRTPIQVDIDGYRSRRQKFLCRLAQKMAHKVRASGRPATTPPLNLNERRILHNLFRQEPGLESRSKHHEKDRKVVVLMKRA